MLSKWGIVNRERWVEGRKGRSALPKPQIIQSAALTMFTHISERHSHPERHSLPTASSGAIHSSALPSKRMTWSVLGVCQHRCRVQGTALSWELLLMLPSQENHKTEEGQPRCPGENRLKLSLSERIRDWEPLPRVHLGDICKNFCVHPESHACK